MRAILAISLFLMSCSYLKTKRDPAQQSDSIAVPVSAKVVDYHRAAVGENISDQELQNATDQFIEILKKSKYFDSVDAHMHGWPESDKSKSFWWGTYWSGIHIFKKNGRVTYLHPKDGSDNNGFRTAPYIETACYAFALNHDPKLIPLIRKMVRGFSSWILASDQLSKPSMPKVLSRAHYTQNVTVKEPGREYDVDYSQNRPGIHSTASDYVHIVDNPTFGDIWTKNSRTIDDLGAMIQAMALLKTCDGRLGSEAQADMDQMWSLYSQWAADVDHNHFEIPMIDKNANYKLTSQSSAFEKFQHQKLLVAGQYAMRLLHQDDPGNLKKIGNSDFVVEGMFYPWLKNDVFEILRTLNLAAMSMSYNSSHSAELVPAMYKRLEKRIDVDMDYLSGEKKAAQFEISDIPSLLISATTLGLPLTAKEIRFVHKSLDVANKSITENMPVFNIFDPNLADGEYNYDFPDSGIQFRSIGLILGSCSSIYRNPKNLPLVNCQRVQDYLISLKKADAVKVQD